VIAKPGALQPLKLELQEGEPKEARYARHPETADQETKRVAVDVVGSSVSWIMAACWSESCGGLKLL
jgi:hypothetical protein